MRGNRLIQIGFVLLLLICAAQVGWWLIDQALFSWEARAALSEHLLRDEKVATMLLERGVPREEIRRLFAELKIQPDGEPRIDPEVLARVDLATARRSRRYAWEGGFFLLVLLAGIGVLWRTLREEARLRRRQQNFLAVVSHELKSPLASIRLAAETLELRDPEPGRRARLVQRIVGNLQRVEWMVRNLLDAARLEEGKFQIERGDVALASIVRSVLATSADRLREAGVEVDNAVSGELVIRADPTAVETVLSNLVDNARKSIERQGGGRLALRARKRGRQVELQVEDSGVGFKPREAARLFAKFYRPGDEMRRGGEGSGLGLYIVRRLVELGGGEIEAASEGPGRGACFTIRWPVAEEKR